MAAPSLDFARVERLVGLGEGALGESRLAEAAVACVEMRAYMDGVFAELYDTVPENTYFIVTADHGELFGEDDYFGHGPIMHEKCFEVPFLEGLRPSL